LSFVFVGPTVTVAETISAVGGSGTIKRGLLAGLRLARGNLGIFVAVEAVVGGRLKHFEALEGGRIGPWSSEGKPSLVGPGVQCVSSGRAVGLVSSSCTVVLHGT
jgi:hypothetical protein